MPISPICSIRFLEEADTDAVPMIASPANATNKTLFGDS